MVFVLYSVIVQADNAPTMVTGWLDANYADVLLIQSIIFRAQNLLWLADTKHADAQLFL
jgi:hypothetical protein